MTSRSGLGAVIGAVLAGRLLGSPPAGKLRTAGMVHLVVAAVALPNEASVGLHLSQGFREVGTFTEYAVKCGRRISSVWFEKLLNS